MSEIGTSMFDLTGQVALVTGGGRGLGRGIAIALAQAGANVAVASRTLSELEQVRKNIESLGRRSCAVQMNILQTDDIALGFEEVVQYFGTLDILVNAAGINIRKKTSDISEKDWNQVVDINLKGTFFCSQAASKIMLRKGKGKIINIASLGAEVGLPDIAPYCASKGGVRQLTRALAIDWAPHINVNAIGPGYFLTELTRDAFENSITMNRIMSRIPMGRTGNPEDLYGAAIFLASRASDYVTGHSLNVDGGWLAG